MTHEESRKSSSSSETGDIIHGNRPKGVQQFERNRPAHKVKDLAKVDDLETNFGPVARQIVDVLRARTFSGHESAWLLDDMGRKVYIRVTLNTS